MPAQIHSSVPPAQAALRQFRPLKPAGDRRSVSGYCAAAWDPKRHQWPAAAAGRGPGSHGAGGADWLGRQKIWGHPPAEPWAGLGMASVSGSCSAYHYDTYPFLPQISAQMSGKRIVTAA